MIVDEMPTVGIVLIGRNEGERFRLCLNSVIGLMIPIVYVDSGSSDGSVTFAQSMGVSVVRLDASRPFTAARARNAGLDRLLELHPDVQFVQFVDGDCELIAGWLERGCEYLCSHSDVAVVCGRRRERFPERTLYNRICDIEWNGPVGETDNCGGDSLMRCSMLKEVGVFNDTVPAGEEPELCQRFHAMGWKVIRLDEEMTLHDAAMTRFLQWYRRQIRTGYGGLNVASRFGIQRFRRQVRSALAWTLGYVTVLIGGTFSVSLLAGAWIGTIAGIVLLTIPFVQCLRIGLRIHREKELPLRLALIYGILTMLSKYIQLVGFLGYWRDRIGGKRARLIEYKDPFTVRAGTVR